MAWRKHLRRRWRWSERARRGWRRPWRSPRWAPRSRIAAPAHDPAPRRSRSAHDGAAARQRRTAEKPRGLAACAGESAPARGRPHRRRPRRPAAGAGGPVQGRRSWVSQASAPTSPMRPSLPRSDAASKARRGCAGCRRRPSSRSTPGETSVRLELAEGGTLSAALVVAADGRNSMARAAAGIAVRTWTYGQAAVAASFGHARPHAGDHHGVASARRTADDRAAAGQRVEPGLGGAAGRGRAPRRPRRRGVPGRARTSACTACWARLSDVGPRAAYPLSGLQRRAHGRRTASRWSARPRTSSRRSARRASTSACAMRRRWPSASPTRARAGQDIGGAETLAAYHAARAGRRARAARLAVDLLNRSLLADFLPAQALRGVGLHLLANVAPLRRLVMQRRHGAGGAAAAPDAAGCACPEPLTRRARAPGQVALASASRGGKPCRMPEPSAGPALPPRIPGAAADRGAGARRCRSMSASTSRPRPGGCSPPTTGATSGRSTTSPSPSPRRRSRSARPSRSPCGRTSAA